MSAARTSAAIKYTALRLAIFVGCFVVVAGLVQVGALPKGLGDSNFVWVVLLSLVLSAPLSFVLLRKQRDAMSAQIVTKVDSAKARLEANRKQEDGVTQ
ncbi:membrane protein [Streptomyces kurssanovii]|nr:membrane protein [Streptomyces kurssanovii]